MTLNHVVLTRPDALAVTLDGGGSFTYRQLDERSIRLANLFRAHGLVHGDRVALLMDNGLDYATAIWAARRAGLSAVPINWQLTAEDIAYLVDDSDARAVIASTRFAALAQTVTAGREIPLRLADGPAFEGFVPLGEAIAGLPLSEPAAEPDGTPMYYSSGTTGRPKGIHKETGLTFGDRRPIELLYRNLYGLVEGGVLLLPAPLYFAAPCGWLSAGTALGAHVVILPRFDGEAVLAAIERYCVTIGLFVPTHFVRLLRLPEAVRSRHDLSSLASAVHAGAPCPVEVKREMIDWWGPIIHEFYSGSEGAGFTSITSAEWLERPGSVGRAVTGAVHILDDDGQELAPGGIGAIWFEGAAPFQYHKAPEKTAAFFNDRGWGTLGDLGSLDAEGYLTIANRRTDLILSGGANVYPQEIENAAGGHPAVLDVAAVGVPDPEFGQTVRLLVQLAPGHEGSAALREELMAYCRHRLAGYKCPRSLVFVESLPRLANGKLLRRDIPAELRAPELAQA